MQLISQRKLVSTAVFSKFFTNLLFRVILLLILSNHLYGITSIAFYELQNELTDNKLYWLSNAIPIHLMNSIECKNYYILDQDDISDMYEQLGLQPNMTLTYATLIKLSVLNKINYALIGNAKNENEHLYINAFFYDTITDNSLHIKLDGNLKDILKILSSLANKITSYLNSNGAKCTYYSDIFQESSPYSFEMLSKAIQENKPEKMIKFLKYAIKENNNFNIAKLYLAQLYFKLADYEKTLDALKDIPSSSSLYKKALFLKANTIANQNKFVEALNTYLEVSKLHLSSSIFNNIAVTLIKQKNYNHSSWYLSQALSILPDNPNIILNYALLNLLTNNATEAKKYLMNYINKNPKNFTAHFLMEYLAKKANNPPILNTCTEIANEFGNYNSIKAKFDENIINYTKIETDLDPELKFKFQTEQIAKNTENTFSALNGYKNRIKENIKRKEYAKSLEDLSKAIFLKPYDWELHYLKGLYYYSINDSVNAKKYLEFSLWCENNPESAQLLSIINSNK